MSNNPAPLLHPLRRRTRAEAISEENYGVVTVNCEKVLLSADGRLNVPATFGSGHRLYTKNSRGDIARVPLTPDGSTAKKVDTSKNYLALTDKQLRGVMNTSGSLRSNSALDLYSSTSMHELARSLSPKVDFGEFSRSRVIVGSPEMKKKRAAGGGKAAAGENAPERKDEDEEQSRAPRIIPNTTLTSSAGLRILLR